MASMIDNEMTLLTDAVEQTDKTDFSHVSNADFMQGLFGELEGDFKAFVVSKKGDPRNGGYPAKIWNGQALPNNANNYYAIATFHPDETGNYKRQKAFCESIYVIVLDDIGEKVAFDKVEFASTYRLETSENNYQYGYKLKEPLTDLVIADRLADALVNAGLTDAGMNGYSTRLARQPKAINGKYNPQFQCRLDEWNPELSYSLEELCEGLGISLEPEAKPKQRQAKEQQSHGLHAALYTPAPTHNPVIEELERRGL